MKTIFVSSTFRDMHLGVNALGILKLPTVGIYLYKAYLDDTVL